MKYFLDTSAIFQYLKAKSVYARIEKELSPFDTRNTALISIVTLGELESLAVRCEWDTNKKNQLQDLLSKCKVVAISADIIDRYAEIDAFSQGLHASIESDSDPTFMGKNDLWIAATASTLGAILITIDKDFSHLENHFLDLKLLSVRGKFLN